MRLVAHNGTAGIAYESVYQHDNTLWESSIIITIILILFAQFPADWSSFNIKWLKHFVWGGGIHFTSVLLFMLLKHKSGFHIRRGRHAAVKAPGTSITCQGLTACGRINHRVSLRVSC